MDDKDRAQDKERQFLEAYDTLSEAIFRHCYYRLSDTERAHDLVQETFLKAWRYMSNGGEIKTIRAFLYRTASNLIIDEYRKRKTDSLDDLEETGFEPGFDPRSETEIKIDAEGARVLLEKLPPRYREVIVMRYIDELSPKEIAAITGEKENNISVRLNRALKRINSLLINYEQ